MHLATDQSLGYLGSLNDALRTEWMIILSCQKWETVASLTTWITGCCGGSNASLLLAPWPLSIDDHCCGRFGEPNRCMSSENQKSCARQNSKMSPNRTDSCPPCTHPVKCPPCVYGQTVIVCWEEQIVQRTWVMPGAQEAGLVAQELWLRPQLKSCLDGDYVLTSGGRGRYLPAALPQGPAAEEPASSRTQPATR